MSIFEYDKEEEERKLRKAEFEAGEQWGITKGIAKGIAKGKQLGIQQGISHRNREIAQSLAEKGMSVVEIADILQVSEKDVQEMMKR